MFADDSLGLRAQALAAAPVGVICVSGRTGRYEFINAEFARLIGRDERETLAADPFEVWKAVTHPDDIEVEQQAVARLAKGEIDRFELDKRFVSPSGEARWVHVLATASRDPEQRLASMTVFFTDLEPQRRLAAERDRLEAQLRRSQKLEALGKLAGGVAHDFNNRLLIIMGYSEILKRSLPSDSPMRQHLDLILGSSQRAADLTRQLLAYSRRQVLKPQSFDLNTWVDGMRRLLEGLMGDRVALTMTLGARSPVLFDPGQLEQVLLNLALNARDAMPEGGRFEVETYDVKIDAASDSGITAGDYVMLLVRDTGTGISPEVLPHIFEPFFTTKEVGQGTGLGLSMVEGIVHQSGGAVRVSTREGDGTTFSIYLPQANASTVKPRYSVEESPRHTAEFETVLVCEDDDGVRKLLADVLEFRAYKLLQAQNGRHALEIASQHPGVIHLLITDVVMPEMDGVELATRLRGAYPELAVLYLSGYTEQPEALSVPLPRRTRFLAKPFLPGDLTSAVAAMLESEAPSGS